MSRISINETAILGLLYEHHHYAYRIKEIMEKRGMNSWADVKFSKDNLKGLQKKNLIKNEVKNGEKVYFITDEGKAALINGIKELLSTKNKVNYPIDLAFANIDVLSGDEIIQSLEIYLESIEGRIGFINDAIKIQMENNVPYNFIAIYKHSKALLKAEKLFIEEFIQELKEMK